MINVEFMIWSSGAQCALTDTLCQSGCGISVRFSKTAAYLRGYVWGYLPADLFPSRPGLRLAPFNSRAETGPSLTKTAYSQS